MVDDRRARIRRNMARAWAFAAAAYASSTAGAANISWDLYGNPIGLGGGLVSATLSTPPASGPTIFEIATDISDPTTSNQHVFSASIGTASTNRRVFVVGNVFNVTNRIVAASIGGVAATIHWGGDESIPNTPVIFSAIVPTGATANVTVSYSGGAAPVANLYCRMYHADNSLFVNASPTVAVATALQPVASLTVSTNAIVLFAAIGRISVATNITVSPASNIALTINAPTVWQKFGFANSVTAQVATVPAHYTTVTESTQVAVLTWR